MSENKAPALPAEISPDGRELWDWAGKLSEHVHRLDRIRVLSADINRIQRECGSCQHWMTRQCPKERNVNGRNRGPSMSAPICERFVMKSSSAELMQKWQSELNVLRSQS